MEPDSMYAAYMTKSHVLYLAQSPMNTLCTQKNTVSFPRLCAPKLVAGIRGRRRRSREVRRVLSYELFCCEVKHGKGFLLLPHTLCAPYKNKLLWPSVSGLPLSLRTALHTRLVVVRTPSAYLPAAGTARRRARDKTPEQHTIPQYQSLHNSFRQFLRNKKAGIKRPRLITLTIANRYLLLISRKVYTLPPAVKRR